MANDFHFPAHVFFDPDAPGSGLPIIHPDLLHARELALDRLQQERDAFTILDISPMHHDFEQQS